MPERTRTVRRVHLTINVGWAAQRHDQGTTGTCRVRPQETIGNGESAMHELRDSLVRNPKDLRRLSDG